MNAAQYFESNLPSTSKSIFFQTWPGWTWGRYEHRKLYSERTVCVGRFNRNHALICLFSPQQASETAAWAGIANQGNLVKDWAANSERAGQLAARRSLDPGGT
jgi:hypothetical protein